MVNGAKGTVTFMGQCSAVLGKRLLYCKGNPVPLLLQLFMMPVVMMLYDVLFRKPLIFPLVYIYIYTYIYIYIYIYIHIYITARFNIYFISSTAPSAFKLGLTNVIPKTKHSTNPSQYRLITMSSKFCRLFHTILARIIENTISYNPRQKSFVWCNGIAEYIFLLKKLSISIKIHYAH